MAAAHASPKNRGKRNAGHPQHASQQQAPNQSSNPVVLEGIHSNFNDQRIEHNASWVPLGIPHTELRRPDGQLHYICNPNNTALPDDLRKMEENLPNDLVARAIPSSEEGYLGKDYEIQHLRTQVKSVGVLQDLLADARSEIQGLHEVVGEQEALLKQHGLQVAHSIQDKIATLRLGSPTGPDIEWSVELKRPPCSSHIGTTHIDGRDHLTELMRQLEEKDKEIADLHRLLQASEDEKAREIAHLKELLQNSCQDRQTSEAICRSLNGETEVLKTRIQRLMEECQGLTRELGSWKRKKITEKNQSPAMISEASVSLEEELQESRQRVDDLERKNSQLSGQLGEVTRMNKRWQKYSRQQDCVKDDLTHAKSELEKRSKDLELRCREYEDLMNQLQLRLEKVDEGRRHQRVNDTLAAGREASTRRLERRVAELEQELARARKDSSRYDGEVVKQQLKQYTEDFQKEHTEKEKLKRENLILMRNHHEAEDLVQELSRKVDEVERENQDLRQRLYRIKTTYAYPENLTRERRELIPHGAPQNSPVVSLENFPTLPKDVQPDGRIPFTPPSSSPQSPPISPSPVNFPSPLLASSARGEDCVDGRSPKQISLYKDDDEALQCPRCLREFPVSKHSDFIRHMESCLDT